MSSNMPQKDELVQRRTVTLVRVKKSLRLFILKWYYRRSRVRTLSGNTHAAEYTEVSFLKILVKTFVRNENRFKKKKPKPTNKLV